MDKIKQNISIGIFIFLITLLVIIVTIMEIKDTISDLNYCKSKGYDGVDVRDSFFNHGPNVCVKDTDFNNLTGRYTRIYGEIKNE